jgi:hypothetical protein
MDFKGIFDRHFFSNHHVEAQQLEMQMEQVYTHHECISYSSFSALLIATLDELCERSTTVCVAWDRPRTQAFNAFCRATGRPEVQLLDATEIALPRPHAALPLEHAPKGVLLRAGRPAGWLLELSGMSPLLYSAGMFVTQNPELAEKVRWARSSYGRRATAEIRICANGRISELQSHVLNQTLSTLRNTE